MDLYSLFLKAVPTEISELAGFRELANATAEFETSLGRSGLIPDWDETRGDKLRSFSSDVELHFAVKKRNSVVAKARDLLTTSDYKSHVVCMFSLFFEEKGLESLLDVSCFMFCEIAV